jgi:hypothetical protein
MVNIHLSGSFYLGIQEGGIAIITCVNVWWNGTSPIPPKQ